MSASRIDWSRIQEVFLFSYDLKVPNEVNYTDSEVDGQVTETDLTPLFTELDAFAKDSTAYTGHHKSEYFQSDTEPEPLHADMRTYETNTTKLVFIVSKQEDSEDHWAFLYESPSQVFVIGNTSSHPFVHTATFSFGNSDGSTYDSVETALSLRGIIDFVKKKCVEYLFEQFH